MRRLFARDLAADTATGAPCVDAVDCNQFVRGPVPAAGLRTFTVRRFAKLPDRQRWATVRPEERCLASAPEGILEPKGCGHESEKPCSRLLSADTFPPPPCPQPPRSISPHFPLP